MSSEPVLNDDEALMRELHHEVRVTPPLGDAEEADLLARWARGDHQSQARLVAGKLAMVIRLAEARRERGLSVPDLVQEGSLGLVEALRSFDGSGAASFDAFAERKVAEQMDSALAAEAAAVREAERTRYVAQVVTEARRRHDEELLSFIEPDVIDIEDGVDGE